MPQGQKKSTSSNPTPPASSQSQSKKNGGRAHGALGYTPQDMLVLAKAVELVKPMGVQEWDAVTRKYNEYGHAAGRQFRTIEALRSKFKTMVNSGKPTGDPDCPEHIRVAKRAQLAIEERASMMSIDDDEEDLGVGAPVCSFPSELLDPNFNPGQSNPESVPRSARSGNVSQPFSGWSSTTPRLNPTNSHPRCASQATSGWSLTQKSNLPESSSAAKHSNPPETEPPIAPELTTLSEPPTRSDNAPGPTAPSATPTSTAHDPLPDVENLTMDALSREQSTSIPAFSYQSRSTSNVSHSVDPSVTGSIAPSLSKRSISSSTNRSTTDMSNDTRSKRPRASLMETMSGFFQPEAIEQRERDRSLQNFYMMSLHEANANVKRLESDKEHLHLALNEKQSENLRLQDEVIRLREEKERYLNDTNFLRNEKNQLEKENRRLRDELHDVKGQLDRLQSKYDLQELRFQMLSSDSLTSHRGLNTTAVPPPSEVNHNTGAV